MTSTTNINLTKTNTKKIITTQTQQEPEPVVLKFLSDNSGAISEVAIIILSITLTVIVSLIKSNNDKLNQVIQNVLKPAPKLDISKKALIQGTIGTILGMSRADRVLILEFHNGNKLSSGYCFNKITATYEIVVPQYSSIAMRFQSIPVSLVNSVLKELEEKKYICISGEEKKEKTYADEVFDTSTDTYFLTELNCTTKENLKKPLGYLLINYVNRKNTDPPTLIIPIIQQYATKLENLLKSD